MGRLRGLDRTEIVLAYRCLFGRSPLAQVRLPSSLVSAEHAVLYWEAEYWHVRDLASRNGTFVNGVPLQRGQCQRLDVGDRVSFGETSTYWTLTESSAPEPCAYGEDGITQCVGHGGLLLLPDDTSPEASVYAVGASWVAEHGDTVSTVQSGDRLRLPSGAWQLFLPAPLKGPSKVTQDAWLDVDKVEIDIGVSANEEHIEVTLRQNEIVRTLPVRAFLYPLLQLARERLTGSNADADGGWVDTEQLSRKLACTREKLNVDIHRIRRLAEAVGLRDAGRLIERRPETRQIRLRTTAVRIRKG